MKKIFKALGLIVIGAFIIVGCSNNKRKQASAINLKDKNNVYAVLAVSSIDTLNQQSIPQK